MELADILNLFSAIVGAIGSLIAFLGSWSIEPSPYGVFAPSDWKEREAARRQRNVRRSRAQRIGFLLIMVAFLLQAGSAFASGALFPEEIWGRSKQVN